MGMALFNYLKTAKSPYHTVEYAKKELQQAGFQELSLKEDFNLQEGGKYFVKGYETSLYAFVVPKEIRSIRIGCAHVDAPTFRLKYQPMVEGSTGNCTRINTEPYGGMLKRTWFDRPLGLAGLVVLRGEDPFQPKSVLFDSGEPWFVIPSLAPHMDHEIEKKELNAQKDLLPICSKSFDLLTAIAEALKVTPEEILDFDLELYVNQEPVAVGGDGAFILSPRIDNVSSVAALVEGMKAASGSVMPMIALFDHEEVGSCSKQGADSVSLSWILEKIFESPLLQGQKLKNLLADSFMISCDVAHGLHPNYPEKADITTKAELGKGFVLKCSATQRYLTDPKAGAVVMDLCSREGIKVQRQANRSDIRGGQTLGPMAASHLPVSGVDMGIPVLGMHSAVETACMDDYRELEHFVKCFMNR